LNDNNLLCSLFYLAAPEKYSYFFVFCDIFQGVRVSGWTPDRFPRGDRGIYLERERMPVIHAGVSDEGVR